MTPKLWPLALAAAGLCFGPTPPARCAEAGGQLEALHRAEALTGQKKWPEAAAAWQKVVDANPHLGRAWRELGTALLNAKEYRRAIPAFEKALELGSGYRADAAYAIACCHAQLGEKEQALAWLQKALDQGLRRIDRIAEDPVLVALHDDERFKKIAGVVDVGKLSRDEGWRFDLDLLVREATRTHYAPFARTPRAVFDAEVRKLREDIPRLTDNQIAVGFMKLLRLLGDGHTGIYRPERGPGAGGWVPVQFYLFAEGLHVTGADAPHADLVGARVLRIGSHTPEEVLRELDAVVPQDNRMGLLWLGPLVFMRRPEVLNGLGLIPDDSCLPLTVRDLAGKEREVRLPADSADRGTAWFAPPKDAPAPVPLYLKKPGTPYWFEYLSAEKLVYCQYNSVMEEGQEETIEKFFKRLFRFIDQNEVDRLVLDLRWNGGGNNFLNQPLIHGLIRCDKVNRPGKLFVIVGRNTFSAAMCCVGAIDRNTRAVFVGEPTGSSPNFVGESAVQIKLPYSKLRASVSDLYWQNTVAMDYRTWVAPQIYAPPTFAAYRANRDPALEAILAYHP
jgi:tetratricopeptide (TPR) repeat protein